MSALVTQLYLLEKYGPRLTTEQLAEVLTSDAGTILNQINGWIPRGRAWLVAIQ